MPELTIQQAFDLALQHHKAGRLPEAEHLYRQILAQQPNHADALHLLGVIAHQVGQHDAAVELIHQALAIQPNFPGAYNNLGLALRDRGHLDEAIAAFRSAIDLKPNYPGAYSNLGNALVKKGLSAEAMAAFRQALAFQPGFHQARCNLLMAMNYDAASTPQSLFEEARLWNQLYASAFAHADTPHANDRNPERRLRIGYVSADFRKHASAHFLLPLFTHHDRHQVEIVCYAEGVRSDDITRRFQTLTQLWRSTTGLTDSQVAQRVREDQIDILVDLKLHSDLNRLLVFARKPAPVQVTWLGYPGTTGLTAMDYRLTDPYLDPPGIDEACYSETSIRLPDTFWCYDPLTDQPPVNNLPALANGWITFGSLNNFCKINDGVLRLWCQVLRQVDNSRLLLHADEGSHRQRTADRLTQLGVDSARLRFVGRVPLSEYRQLYSQIDIALDPFPYGGGTTTCDALWMGVPVVSLAGTTAVGRGGLSILNNTGLADLIATTPEDYVHISVALAHDLSRLADLRSTLRPRMQHSPLMDAPRFARNIETAYRQMWQKYCLSNPQ